MEPYNNSLVEDWGMHWAPSNQQLIAYIYPKQIIVSNHIVLWWMLYNGFKVTTIHRTLHFDQKPSMKKFIGKLVNKRSEAKTKVKKGSLKLF